MTKDKLAGRTVGARFSIFWLYCDYASGENWAARRMTKTLDKAELLYNLMYRSYNIYDIFPCQGIHYGD